MKVRILGDCIPQIDFTKVGCEINNDVYDIVLVGNRNNMLPNDVPADITAMVVYPEKIRPEDSQKFVITRTSRAKSIFVEEDYQFYRQIYRYRESVFWCNSNKGKRESELKRMFDWILWEKTVSAIPMWDYVNQLKTEGINETHCVGRMPHFASQFSGDVDWQAKRINFEGSVFTGYDPKVIEVNIDTLNVAQWKNESEMLAFMNDPNQHPKAANDAPSWRALFYGIAKNGVANPVQVHKYKNGRIVLLKGKHRYIAAQKLGYKTIPAVVSYEV